MGFARLSHTATLLEDGRVLVAGGIRDEGGRGQAERNYASAEIFDPVTEQWTFTEALREARNLHTASRLADGRVLVVGGIGTPLIDLAHPLSSAEIYDPESQRWSSGGTLSIARTSHTATTLANSDVLVVGGVGGGKGGLVSAELYDADTGTWRATGVPAVPRSGHTAALLEDGRVLIAGAGYLYPGENAAEPTTTAEVYDPVTSRWSYTSGMAEKRGMFTANLLGGPSCQTASRPSYCGKVLAVGGGEGS
ncbi:MAG TPA: kelch repeat-containing protein [Acidimicrobiales bacterium]|nr:kelch repeat-containing protein [Acidimicrobiales bacterium]